MYRKSCNDSGALENLGWLRRPSCQDKIEGVQACYKTNDYGVEILSEYNRFQ